MKIITCVAENGKTEVFDPVRKRFVRLTPEESVRQNVLNFLSEVKNVPLSHIGVEKKILVNKLYKRPDIIVFNSDASIALIVECKAPNVALSEDVLNQVIRYNMTLKADYLMITNGINIFCVDCTGKIPQLIDVNDWKYET